MAVFVMSYLKIFFNLAMFLAIILSTKLVLAQDFKPPDGEADSKINFQSSGDEIETKMGKEKIEEAGEKPAETEGKSIKPEGKTMMAGSGYIPAQVPFYHSPQMQGIPGMPMVPQMMPPQYPYQGSYYPSPTYHHRPFYQSNYLENYDVYYSRNNQGRK